MMFSLLSLVKDSKIVFDRSHIGEFVYGPEFRNKMPHYLCKLEKDYKDLNACIVYLKCSYETAFDRLSKRHNDKLDYDKTEYLNLQDRFEFLCNNSPFDDFTLDTSDTTEDELFKIFKERVC